MLPSNQNGLQALEFVVEGLLPFVELADELEPALRVDLGGSNVASAISLHVSQQKKAH